RRGASVRGGLLAIAAGLVPGSSVDMRCPSDVLLVEDDALIARALWRRLGARGARARHVSHCATALGLSGPYRAAIFDIDLPDGDGVELARRLLGRGVVERAVFYTACSN